MKLFARLKDIYYNSFIYRFYSKYILSVPLLRFFVDIDYMAECIRSRFLAVNIIFAVFMLIMSFYGVVGVVREGFVLWCCGGIFCLSYRTFKNIGRAKAVKYFFWLNLVICAIAIFKGSVYSAEITLYLLPFSLVYVVYSLDKIKRITGFLFVVLLSVFAGVRGGGAVLSGIALEIIVFCLLFSPGYIFAVVFIVPAATAALINKILYIRREFMSAGLTLNNIIAAAYVYINNGLKGDTRLFSRALSSAAAEVFYNISPGEKLFIYAVLFIALITVLYLGRYIFRLIRKTVLLLRLREKALKPLVVAAISFFAGTSFSALLLPLSADACKMLLYWSVLGFIRTLHK